MKHLYIENDRDARWRWYRADKRQECPSHFLCTNDDGEGIFSVDLDRNERHQLVGTCDFSLAGIKDPRRKIRRRYED